MFTVILLAVLLLRISETIDNYDQRDSGFSSAALQFAHQEMKPDHKVSPEQRRALDRYLEAVTANVDHEADERLWWDLLFTFGLLTSLSYLLQALYGAVIWTVYRDRFRWQPLGHRRA